MQVLLEHGAEIEAVNVNGTTVLAYAAHSGKLAAATFLHDRGSSAIVANREGNLPLHHACCNGHMDVARFLLQKHPNTVNVTTFEENDRWTSLHLVAQNDNVDGIQGGPE